uniref:UDP-glucuronosyltransferase n=1 Tax=Panagrellus redivivus TaxID=6233 RepID=A0A7E4USZ0_PANRE
MLKVAILAGLVCQVHSLNVLLYQTTPASSHVAFSGAIVDALVDAGHTVDKLIALWNPYILSNGTTKARRVLRFNLNKESPWMSMPHLQKPFETKYSYPGDAEPVEYRKTLTQFCEQMLDSGIVDWIKEGNYDVALTAAYDACGHGMFYVAGIKSVLVYSPTTLIDHWTLLYGLPAMASYQPNLIRNNGEGDRPNFFQRLSILADRVWQQQIVLPSYHEVQTKVFRAKYGQNFPTATELAQKSIGIFVNSHPILELQRPYCAKVKQIGGITLRKAGKLSSLFEGILKSAKKGVILFSFGSLAKTDFIPYPVLLMFVEVFKKFKDYNVIWKFDLDDTHIFDNVTNIYPVKWTQQIELLNDPRVKLFISHSGQNSMLESAHAGIPVLSIPLFLDQNYNSLVLERRGSAIRLNKHDLTADVMERAMWKLLNEPKYRENAKALQKMLKNWPINPRETLVNWVEYAAGNPALAEHLQISSANMGLIQYFCIDVLVFVGILFVGIIFGAVLMVRKGLEIFNVTFSHFKRKME